MSDGRMLTDAEYIAQLEGRLAILRQSVDAWREEAATWQNKYELVEGRIEALEMIKADAEVRNDLPVGRMLYVSVTLNEDMILQSKDRETMAEMVINDAWKRLAHELKGSLIEGRLLGNRIPMLRKAKWTL